ncbi:hypothetical protein Dda_2403 [Drechslerella dactyloides]|uniref:Uncharacterized protein n=1 Tax=Drechslerella dactyloides TaxID=74499 RepID=A0AAD6NLH4_DREDA|nr:hypothetical protein Dda_2403 [Drechslerella dactyloides]
MALSAFPSTVPSRPILNYLRSAGLVSLAILLLFAIIVILFILIPTSKLDALGRYTGYIPPNDLPENIQRTYRQAADEAAAQYKNRMQTIYNKDFDIQWARKARAQMWQRKMRKAQQIQARKDEELLKRWKEWKKQQGRAEP